MGGGDATGVSFNGIRWRAWQGKELNPTFLASHATIYACILEYRLCFARLPSSLFLCLPSQPDRGAKIIESIPTSPIIRKESRKRVSFSFFLKGAVRIIRLRDKEGKKKRKREKEKKNREWNRNEKNAGE